MQELSLGVGLANRFVAWWGVWRLALEFDVARFYPSGGAGVALTEDRVSSAWVLQSNGAYVERAAGELALGQGVGVQVSEAVTSFNPNSDLTGAVVGVIGAGGSLPTGWGYTISGALIEILEITTHRGLPALKIKVSGTPNTHWRIRTADVGDITVSAGQERQASVFCKTVAGTPPASTEYGYVYYDGGVFLAATLPDVPAENLVSGDQITANVTVPADADGANTELFFSHSGLAVDWTFLLAAPNETLGHWAKPVVVGAGDTVMRGADNPVVVQGVGEVLVTNGDFSDGLEGWTYAENGGLAPDPYVTAGVLHIPRTITGNTWTITQQLATALVVGVSYRLKFTVKQGYVRVRMGSTKNSGNMVSADKTPGVYEVEFTASSVTAWAYFRPLLNDQIVQIEVIHVERLLPYEGYDPTGVADGVELVDGGTFEGQVDVDLWTERGSATTSLIDDALHIDSSGGGYGGAFRDFETDPGSVYQLSGEQVAKGGGATDVDVFSGPNNGASYNEFVAAEAFVDGPFFFLPTTAALTRVDLRTGGNGVGEFKQFDNISLQRVKPGVVIEAVAVWGGTDGQIAFRLSDDSVANEIKVHRLNSGTLRLAILKDGGLLYGSDAVGAWPDNTEASLRLEMTDTAAGTFYALFLDSVFTGLGAGPIAYPDAITQLDFAPVAGAKSIKAINAR